jgi:DNA-binding response OmpR family regulator
VLDLQIGNMGGVAAALDLRLEESGGRLPRATILLLLDRDADKFLGRRADVDAMLVKPVDAGVLRRAARQLLERVS